ncbi:MAG: HAD-IA family hydrolase [Cohaesibacter sp.]|nr:HAD-IA family hydrolase [Cohaesibacter sp.]MCV6603023.1 HAD-IA family hydrolase [Cohaesibacter sp.]
MTSSSRTSLLFDLDGTLVDTAPDLIDALNVAISEQDLKPVPSSLVRPYVGLGGLAMLSYAYRYHEKAIEEAQLLAAHQHFRRYYEDNICVHSKMYDGVLQVIPALYDEGYHLSVCTNKPQYLAIQLLEQLDMAQYFATICGSDTVPNRKPHRDHLAITAKRAGTSLDNSIMIGDATPDVEAARNADIPVIGFDYGYSTIAMADLAPDLLLSCFRDLPSALKALA